MFLGGSTTKIYVTPPSVAPISTTTTGKTVATTTKTLVKANKATTTPIKKPVETKPVAKPVSTPPQPTEPEPDFVAINNFARKATVNILCNTKGGELSPISGTGAVVDSHGLILTNAHIAQYLLLKDFGQKDYVQCVARTGSPAYPKYKLELVYISPAWVENNKTQLKEQNPKGTGENDFAFLRITTMIDGSAAPETIPFIPMNVRENITVSEPVLLSSYPAGFLGGLSILQDLSITTTVTTIQDLFTFKDGTIDIVAVGGTVVSQKGSSGGLVVDSKATLIGVISTSSDGKTTSERKLNAITLAYINRELQKEMHMDIVDFLSQSGASFAESFQKNTAPLLTKTITDELIKR